MTSLLKDKYINSALPKILMILTGVCLFSCDENELVHYKEDGTIDAEGMLVNGKKEGEWKFYDDEGNLDEISTWKNDAVNGASKTYYENGQLKSEANWQMGLIHGLQQIWTENGEILQEVNWKEDKKAGKFVSYYKDEIGRAHV